MGTVYMLFFMCIYVTIDAKQDIYYSGKTKILW